MGVRLCFDKPGELLASHTEDKSYYHHRMHHRSLPVMLAGSVGEKELDRGKEKRKISKPGPGLSCRGMSNKHEHMEDVTC